MKAMANQYLSVLRMSLPADPTPEPRALFEVIIIHELMKHVYYVRSLPAESAILGKFPEYTSDRTHSSRRLTITSRTTPQGGNGFLFALITVRWTHHSKKLDHNLDYRG